MLFLSTLRVWRYEAAARRARPMSERKRTPAVMKRKPNVELLEERVPMGTFFNGFGLGSTNIMPLGMSLPESTGGSAPRATAVSRSLEDVQGLEDNAAALTVAILSRNTNADSAGAASQVSEAVDSLVTDADTGSGLETTPVSTGSGGEVVPPNTSLQTQAFPGFASLPPATPHTPAPVATQPPAPAPSHAAADAQLFQAASTAASTAGKTGGSPTSGSSAMPAVSTLPGSTTRTLPAGMLDTPKWPFVNLHMGHAPTGTSSGGSTQPAGTPSSGTGSSGVSPQTTPLSPGKSASTPRSPNPLVGPIMDPSQFIGGFGSDEVEESITINPTNTNNIFVEANAAQGGGLIGSMFSYTFDGGNTWHSSYVGAGGNSTIEQSFGDPSAAFDRFGNLWISYLDAGTIQSPEATPDGPVILLSTDGGIGFHQVEDLEDTSNAGTGIDQPKLAVGANSVWEVWSDGPDLTEPDGRIQSATASFGGFLGNWQGFFNFHDNQPTPDGGTFQNFGKIAVGPNNQVVYTFQDPNSGNGPDNIWMAYDPLGTRGFFGTPTLVTTTNVGAFSFVTNQPFRLIDAESEPAYDNSNGTHRGRLYMVETDRPNPLSNSTDIFVLHSDNNGATWSSPIRVTDDHTGAPKILPRIVVDPITGDVGVSWIDARNDPTLAGGEEFMAFSHDGGVTWSKNIQVSGANVEPQLTTFDDPVAGFDFGDYTGLAFYNGLAYPAWPDNSADIANVNLDTPGSMDVATARVTDPFAPGSPGGGGGGFTDTLFNGVDNDNSNIAVNEGVLFSTGSVNNVQIGPNGTDTFPDQDWFKWTMAKSGTFSATETTDFGGPLELHVFKLVNGTLVNIGNATGNNVNSLSASVSQNDTIFVEVKGTTGPGGASSTGQYHLNVSL
jgi:hypothetical protein